MSLGVRSPGFSSYFVRALHAEPRTYWVIADACSQAIRSPESWNSFLIYPPPVRARSCDIRNLVRTYVRTRRINMRKRGSVGEETAKFIRQHVVVLIAAHVYVAMYLR